jgi:acyl-CoA dehydrogenase
LSNHLAPAIFRATGVAPMIIDQESIAPLLARAERFAQDRIAVATSRPEAPIGVNELEQLSREAAELGILATPGTRNDFGLWARVDRPLEMAFHIGVLKHVAHADAGVAFAWHRSALAQYLAGALGLKPTGENALGATLTPIGHSGLARTSLAHWLRGAALRPGETDLLADWLDRENHASLLIAPENWKTVFWSVWREGAIRWEAARREDLSVEPVHPQHGLDELAAFTVKGRGRGAALPAGDTEECRELYARVLKLDMIGLLAMGAGAGARGLEMANAYASTTRYGDKLINEYPAVLQMLADIELALSSADIALRSCARPPDDLDVGGMAAIRVSVNAMLRHAANQAVKVYGGYGAVRDAATEKILRDLNVLKGQTGGTRDVALFVAGWRGVVE